MEPSTDPFTKLMETPPMFESWYTWAFILLVAILAGLRSWLRGPVYFGKTSLKGKVALITGGNRGLGYHVAKELATRGAKVYIGCRDSALGRAAEGSLRDETRNKEIFYMPLKLGSVEEVRKFSDALKKKEDKLDILYCNAGVMTCPPTRTVDGFEYHFGVNYIGHYVLVNELLDMLKAAESSRLVIVTSAAYALGKINYDDINHTDEDYGNGATCFSQSKVALMLMANKLSRMLEESGVTVNTCHPGVARTDIHRYMPINTSSFLYMSTLPVCWYLMKTSRDGAQTPIYLCVDEAVKTTTGKYFVDMLPKPIEGVADHDAEADKFWAFTEILVQKADQRRLDKPADASLEQESGQDKQELGQGKQEVGHGEPANKKED